MPIHGAGGNPKVGGGGLKGKGPGGMVEGERGTTLVHGASTTSDMAHKHTATTQTVTTHTQTREHITQGVDGE